MRLLVLCLLFSLPGFAQSPLPIVGCVLTHTIGADSKGERGEAWLAYATRDGKQVRLLGVEPGSLKGMMRAAKDCKNYLKQAEKAAKSKK